MRRWLVLACVAGVLGSLGGCGRRTGGELVPGSLPQVAGMREFAVPWENAFPSDVAVDSAGRLWFTDRLTHVIGMLDPATEEFRSYATPTRRSAPYGLIAAPDGSLWFCQSTGRQLGRVDPATGEITEYPIPDAPGGLHLLAWRDGEIWFSLREARAFGRFDPGTGESTIYQLERDRPYSIAVTADAVWLSSYGAFRLLEVDPATAAVRIHDLSTIVPKPPFPVDTLEAAPARPGRPVRVWPGEVRRIVSGADGSIWFTDFAQSRVIRYDAAAGEMTAYTSLEQRSEPYGLARSSRGHIWYSERGAGRITVLDPRRDERHRITVAGGQTHARHITLDEARGRAWFPLSDIGRIGLIEYR